MKKILVLLGLFASPLMGQTISLSDFAAKVDDRANLLSGYEGFLTDPDPNRSMAALQIMLESGDDNLIRLALEFGIYSPDVAIRRTALTAYIASKPTIDLYFDGGLVPDTAMGPYSRVIEIYGGSIGVDKRASASFSVGDWQEDQGCYVYRTTPSVCLLRINSTTVSIHLPSKSNYLTAQWSHLELNTEGQLVGGVTPLYQGQRVGPLTITMRLTE